MDAFLPGGKKRGDSQCRRVVYCPLGERKALPHRNGGGNRYSSCQDKGGAETLHNGAYCTRRHGISFFGWGACSPAAYDRHAGKKRRTVYGSSGLAFGFAAGTGLCRSPYGGGKRREILSSIPPGGRAAASSYMGMPPKSCTCYGLKKRPTEWPGICIRAKKGIEQPGLAQICAARLVYFQQLKKI